VLLQTTAKSMFPGDIKDVPFVGSVIDSIVITPTVPVTGGNISAVTAQVTTLNNYGSALSVFTATGSKVAYVITTTGFVEPPNTAINLTLVSTGGNLSTATAGTVDVWINRRILR
jgi:hypothetical protein